ncbi:50S ribosomal protein L30 [Thermoanaerobacterium sp. RBIITD]|uniref:50S ribosomal protein L30 n=1 Tax=Thermoanaerobacterium sp. RBIITD TaxID=1550240 RepID=UPI000BB96FFC|nr:50S ribosomal protein L30 [Thermoanaerobacterium sp. RBIITD]SNX54388.1 large subunit ribosomal protein L30 [Thermoanaerobacterium sp. RBIITD]
MAKLKITLIRSTIGRGRSQIDTVKALKLNKIGSSSVLEDTPQVRGMINKVKHLLNVEEVNE